MENKSMPQPYGKFEAAIEDIKTGATQVRFLGNGSESEVFEMSVDDDLYAAKFAIAWTRIGRPRDTARATQRKIDAGMRGLYVPGLEQIQSASTDAGVAIYSLVDGKNVASMAEEEIAQITDDQMASFFETVDAAVEIGIEFDPWNQDGSNVMFSPQEGFTLIDYFVDYAETDKEESRLNGYRSLGSQAINLAQRFGADGYEFRFNYSSVDDFNKPQKKPNSR